MEVQGFECSRRSTESRGGLDCGVEVESSTPEPWNPTISFIQYYYDYYYESKTIGVSNDKIHPPMWATLKKVKGKMVQTRTELQLPPGFRFHPTDEELLSHYLCRKCASQTIDVPIIAEIDLYKSDPWDLPDKALYGEKEWYFFSPRDRKYPNGSRPNRAAGCGYWKATGADKPIGKPKPVGIKKALVFYSGKAPKGEKTNWIMHEFRLADVDRTVRKSSNSLRLDDWVLCRIYNKKGSVEKQQQKTNIIKPPEYLADVSMEEEDKKPEGLFNTTAAAAYGGLPPVPPVSDFMYFGACDSIPRLYTDSSHH
ncbi:hypothetical protein ACFE04_025468 [Oxalis oulophora]